MPAARNSVIDPRELDVIHHELLDQLAAARRQSDALFSLVRVDALYDRPIPERHRIIFYLGHLEAFDWNLLHGRAFDKIAHSEEQQLLRMLAEIARQQQILVHEANAATAHVEKLGSQPSLCGVFGPEHSDDDFHAGCFGPGEIRCGVKSGAKQFLDAIPAVGRD